MLVTVIVASVYSMREEAANWPLVLADQPDEPSSISSPSSLPSTPVTSSETSTDFELACVLPFELRVLFSGLMELHKCFEVLFKLL